MMGLHTELDRRFFVHQQALLDRDFVLATARLDAFLEVLLQHLADEEDLVLPKYEARGGDATDAPLRLFLGEHARIRDFLADFARRLERLRDRPDDRALLVLLDKEASFKNLLLHHDLRERNVLYPFLTARLSEAEQTALLADLRWPG